jgi:hypothetical protein
LTKASGCDIIFSRAPEPGQPKQRPIRFEKPGARAEEKRNSSSRELIQKNSKLGLDKFDEV